jgi:hypothetical protein
MTEKATQLNLTVVALVALVAIVGLVALVLNAARLTTVSTGSTLALAEPQPPAPIAGSAVCNPLCLDTCTGHENPALCAQSCGC